MATGTYSRIAVRIMVGGVISAPIGLRIARASPEEAGLSQWRSIRPSGQDIAEANRVGVSRRRSEQRP